MRFSGKVNWGFMQHKRKKNIFRIKHFSNWINDDIQAQIHGFKDILWRAEDDLYMISTVARSRIYIYWMCIQSHYKFFTYLYIWINFCNAWSASRLSTVNMACHSIKEGSLKISSTIFYILFVWYQIYFKTQWVK